jgi:hypothetical protein
MSVRGVRIGGMGPPACSKCGETTDFIYRAKYGPWLWIAESPPRARIPDNPLDWPAEVVAAMDPTEYGKALSAYSRGLRERVAQVTEDKAHTGLTVPAGESPSMPLDVAAPTWVERVTDRIAAQADELQYGAAPSLSYRIRRGNPTPPPTYTAEPTTDYERRAILAMMRAPLGK